MNVKNAIFGLTAASLLAISACAGQKAPATKTLEAAQAALAAVKEDAAKYMPADLQNVEATFSSLKADLDTGNYKSVLAGTPSLMTSLSTLKDGIATKKVEAEAALKGAREEWGTLSANLPKMVSAIQSRVDILSAAKQLPKGMSKATLDSAKSDLESMKSGWNEAATAFADGNAVDAVAKAKALKETGATVLKKLGMAVG